VQEDEILDTKTLVEQIKAKNRASNFYMFVSVLSGVGTSLLAVLLLSLSFREGVIQWQILWIGAGIAISQI
jgi:hypothetical protein